MSEEKTINDKQIRWLICLIFYENQRAQKREAGGWVRLAMLQRLLQAQGYDLTKEEIHSVYCVYLADKEIGCIEIDKSGDHAPFIYRYRITAKGIRAANGEQKIPGVGLWDQ